MNILTNPVKVAFLEFPGGLVVRHCTFTAEGPASIPDLGTRSHKPHGMAKEKWFFQ